MTKDEALKLALNVLVNRVDSDHDAITAIREALALPVATNDTSQERVDETLKQRHETQPEQEPKAWINWSALTGQPRLGWECESELASEPLYTALLHRKPLTDEEIDFLWRKATMKPGLTLPMVRSFARAIEAKLKEKNT